MIVWTQFILVSSISILKGTRFLASCRLVAVDSFASVIMVRFGYAYGEIYGEGYGLLVVSLDFLNETLESLSSHTKDRENFTVTE